MYSIPSSFIRLRLRFLTAKSNFQLYRDITNPGPQTTISKGDQNPGKEAMKFQPLDKK